MIDLFELKKEIENKNVTRNSYVFQYVDNYFTCLQYAKAIASLLNTELSFVEDFYDSNSLFSSPVIQIKIVDELNTKIKSNQICICKSNTNDLNNDKLVKFPQLSKLNIEEYIYSSLLGFDEKYCTKLCELCNSNIDRIYNEIEKIKYFNVDAQKMVLDKLIENHTYEFDIEDVMFDLVNCILQKNFDKLKEYSSLFDNINIFSLSALLYNSFSNVSKIQLYKNASAEICGLSPKQFWAIKKYNVGKYTNNSLKEILDFLSKIDYNIKVGYFNNKDIEYFILTIISKE